MKKWPEKFVSVDVVLESLKSLCAETSQRKVAEKFGVSGVYISDVLAGRRHPGETILKNLGYSKVVRYEIVHEYKVSDKRKNGMKNENL